MTAERVAERETFEQDLEREHPWVAALEVDEQDDLATVTPIEAPRLREVLSGLSDVVEYLDSDDLPELLKDLKVGLAEDSLRGVVEVLQQWRVTGESLRDPLARAILLGDLTVDDFIQVDRPE